MDENRVDFVEAQLLDDLNPPWRNQKSFSYEKSQRKSMMAASKFDIQQAPGSAIKSPGMSDTKNGAQKKNGGKVKLPNLNTSRSVMQLYNETGAEKLERSESISLIKSARRVEQMIQAPSNEQLKQIFSLAPSEPESV